MSKYQEKHKIGMQGKCHKCGDERVYSTMNHFTSAVFGTLVDPGLTFCRTWFCGENEAVPCWKIVKGDPTWSSRTENNPGRIYHEHNEEIKEAWEKVSKVTLPQLQGMQGLSAGYRLSPSEITRFTNGIQEVVDSLDPSRIQQLSLEEAEICYKILRNLVKQPKRTKEGVEKHPHD